MRWRYKLPLRLRSLFRREKAEMDLREELQFLLASHTIPRVSNSSESFQASAQTIPLVTSWPPRSSVVHFPERFLQQSYNGIEDFVRPEYPCGRRGNRLPG